jgi:hypothetical protein
MHPAATGRAVSAPFLSRGTRERKGGGCAISLTSRPTYVLVLFVPAPADIDDLAMLAEFALLAMARAKAASARAEAVEAEGGNPTIHLRAMDRMGRAMRLALNLRRRFADEAQAQAVQRAQVRKERLKAALSPAIYLHADISERRELHWELDERLETEADALANISLEDGLAHLRQVLGLPVFVASDIGEAGGCNPLSRHAPTAPPEGEQLGATVPPPGRSPIEGEVDRPTGPGRRGLQPTAAATGPP